MRHIARNLAIGFEEEHSFSSCSSSLFDIRFERDRTLTGCWLTLGKAEFAAVVITATFTAVTERNWVVEARRSRLLLARTLERWTDFRKDYAEADLEKPKSCNPSPLSLRINYFERV